jgi:uncharacterized protein (TIGR02246 family)
LKIDNDKFESESQAIISTLTHEWIAAFNAHDVARIVSLYTVDAELFDTGMRQRRKGQSEITAWFTQRFQQMSTIQYTPTSYFFKENEAAIAWLAQGNTPALLRQRWLSRPFQVDGISLFRISAGRIAWQHGYYDHLQIAERVLPPLRWLPLKL